MAQWGDCVKKIGDVEVPTLKCLEVVFANILSMVLSLAALALFVMFIIGGFKFLTSGGDPKATASAKQTMTYAIAGIGLMVLAYLIFRIIEVFTGVKVTIFKIPDFTAP